MPGARCTRSRACCVVNTRVSHHGYTGSPGIPARNGFNGFLRALPGDRAFLSPSPADDFHQLERQRRGVRTTRLHRPQYAVRPRKNCTATHYVHRIPHPTSVTIAKRPSDRDGMCLAVLLFLPIAKTKYFSKQGWTQNREGRPSGKSPARLCRFRALGLGTAYRCREDAILPMRTRDLISARAQLRSSLEERYRVYRRAALKDEAIQVENALRGRHLNSEGAPMIDHHSAALIKSGRSINQADLVNPRSSSITAVGPIGTWPALARLSLRKTILSRQTLRRKSSKT